MISTQISTSIAGQVSRQLSTGFMAQIGICFRLTLVTMFVCSGLYTMVIYGVGQVLSPFTANGSLVRDAQGVLLGSAAVAQGFTGPEYFHPRPSAVEYNAAAAGASNLSPASPQLRERAVETLTRLGATPGHKAPADLVAASGSGLDPNITFEGAKFQAARVAIARGMELDDVMKVVEAQAFRPGGFLTPDRLVNVLRLNLALNEK